MLEPDDDDNSLPNSWERIPSPSISTLSSFIPEDYSFPPYGSQNPHGHTPRPSNTAAPGVATQSSHPTSPQHSKQSSQDKGDGTTSLTNQIPEQSQQQPQGQLQRSPMPPQQPTPNPAVQTPPPTSSPSTSNSRKNNGSKPVQGASATVIAGSATTPAIHTGLGLGTGIGMPGLGLGIGVGINVAGMTPISLAGPVAMPTVKPAKMKSVVRGHSQIGTPVIGVTEGEETEEEETVRPGSTSYQRRREVMGPPSSPSPMPGGNVRGGAGMGTKQSMSASMEEALRLSNLLGTTVVFSSESSGEETDDEGAGEEAEDEEVLPDPNEDHLSDHRHPVTDTEEEGEVRSTQMEPSPSKSLAMSLIERLKEEKGWQIDLNDDYSARGLKEAGEYWYGAGEDDGGTVGTCAGSWTGIGTREGTVDDGAGVETREGSWGEVEWEEGREPESEPEGEGAGEGAGTGVEGVDGVEEEKEEQEEEEEEEGRGQREYEIGSSPPPVMLGRREEKGKWVERTGSPIERRHLSDLGDGEEGARLVDDQLIYSSSPVKSTVVGSPQKLPTLPSMSPAKLSVASFSKRSATSSSKRPPSLARQQPSPLPPAHFPASEPSPELKRDLASEPEQSPTFNPDEEDDDEEENKENIPSHKVDFDHNHDPKHEYEEGTGAAGYPHDSRVELMERLCALVQHLSTCRLGTDPQMEAEVLEALHLKVDEMEELVAMAEEVAEVEESVLLEKERAARGETVEEGDNEVTVWRDEDVEEGNGQQEQQQEEGKQEVLQQMDEEKLGIVGQQAWSFKHEEMEVSSSPPLQTQSLHRQPSPKPETRSASTQTVVDMVPREELEEAKRAAATHAALANRVVAEAQRLQKEVEKAVEAIKKRKEESEHLQAIIASRAKAAAERILDLEKEIDDLEEDLLLNESDLRHLRLSLRAVETVVRTELERHLTSSSPSVYSQPPCVGIDRELLQAIDNWKREWRGVRERMLSRQRERRERRRKLMREGWVGDDERERDEKFGEEDWGSWWGSVGETASLPRRGREHHEREHVKERDVPVDFRLHMPMDMGMGKGAGGKNFLLSTVPSSSPTPMGHGQGYGSSGGPQTVPEPRRKRDITPVSSVLGGTNGPMMRSPFSRARTRIRPGGGKRN